MMRGSRAPVMRPKLPEVTVVPGLFNCGWLKKLKNSARYWSFHRSENGMAFCAEKSTLKAARLGVGAGGAGPEAGRVQIVVVGEVGAFGGHISGPHQQVTA